MRFSVRVDSRNPAHVRFVLFANGGLCNSPASNSHLCMRLDEFDEFVRRLEARVFENTKEGDKGG